MARECDVPEILPAAFYVLFVQKWSSSAEGGRSHLVLHSSDLRRLISGRERLADVMLSYALNPIPDPQASLICCTCRPRIEHFWRLKLAPNPMSPWGCWLLRELRQMTPEEDSTQRSAVWCADCTFQHHCLVWDRMRSLKKAIPTFFLLG